MFDEFDEDELVYYNYETDVPSRNLKIILTNLVKVSKNPQQLEKDLNHILKKLYDTDLKFQAPEIKLPLIWTEINDLFEDYYTDESKEFIRIWNGN